MDNNSAATLEAPATPTKKRQDRSHHAQLSRLNKKVANLQAKIARAALRKDPILGKVVTAIANLRFAAKRSKDQAAKEAYAAAVALLEPTLPKVEPDAATPPLPGFS